MQFLFKGQLEKVITKNQNLHPGLLHQAPGALIQQIMLAIKFVQRLHLGQVGQLQ